MTGRVDADCPKCGIVHLPDNGSHSFTCPFCGSHLDTVQCRECRRMVTSTWFGLCGPHSCEDRLTPEVIAEARSNLERILNS